MIVIPAWGALGTAGYYTRENGWLHLDSVIKVRTSHRPWNGGAGFASPPSRGKEGS